MDCYLGLIDINIFTTNYLLEHNYRREVTELLIQLYAEVL